MILAAACRAIKILPPRVPRRSQTEGIQQVNTAVASIDQGTQQNAALVEQSAAAAESLKQQAAGLLGLVAAFKLADPHHAAFA